MNIPIEILTAVAVELNASELSNFRLVNKIFAIAATPVLPKNGLSVMNSSNDIQALQQLLSCSSISNNVKTLRLLHLEWPSFTSRRTQTIWIREDSMQARQLKSEGIAAYEQYSRDQKPRYFDHVEELTKLLKSLSNLETIVVSSLHDCFWSPNSNKRYQRLQKAIPISPYHSTEVSGTLEQLLLASNKSLWRRTKRLQIFGCLDPSMLHLNKLSVNLHFIQHLTVQGFRISENGESIGNFLGCFPNLKELSISFHGWGPITILESLRWSQLKEVSLHGLWTAEKEFYALFKNHATTLQRFDINSSSLTQGSWESLFTKMRDLKSQAAVSASGELYGRTARETLNMDCGKAISLEKFMLDSSVAWPFLRV